MFEAKLEQAGTLKKIIEAIRDMLGECNFECNDNGISLQSLDKSHIVLVSLVLGNDGFANYRCDRSVTLGININSFATILRCGDASDELTLEAKDDGSAQNLKISFEDPKKDRMAEYEMKLMDIEQEYLTIPSSEYSATITMPSEDLQRFLRDAKAISDSVTIEADKESVRFTAEGETANAKITVKPYHDIDGKDKSTEISVAEPVKLAFNLQYFNNIAKSASMSSTVTMHLSPDMPAEIIYKLPNGSVKYYFAPKIDDDE